MPRLSPAGALLIYLNPASSHRYDRDDLLRDMYIALNSNVTHTLSIVHCSGRQKAK
jgi:hypothetical protein